MKLIILAAGIGKRMQPLTFEKPKPMLLLCGKPLLEHIIGSFPDECDEILLVIGYKGEQIKAYFGDNFKGKKITYIDQGNITGTAHAALLCKPFLKEGERFFLVYADDLHDPKAIKKCLQYDQAMLVFQAEHPERFGVVEVDSDNRILEIVEKPEKPKSNLVGPGVYLLSTKVFEYAPFATKGEFYLTSMIEQMVKDTPVYAVHSSFWTPIGYPEDLKNAEEKMQRGEITASAK